MPHPSTRLQRRDFLTTMLASTAYIQTQLSQLRAQEVPRDVFFELRDLASITRIISSADIPRCTISCFKLASNSA